MSKRTSYIYLFVFLLAIASLACKHTVRQVSNDSLPFFNKPDWTPEWIDPTDSAYVTIHTIPEFSFIDQNGMVFDQNRIKGKIYVANFFFTKCRMICPKMTTNMSMLQEAFRSDSSIHLVSHSVTPELDSVSVLRKYANENNIDDSKWTLLTGDLDAIYTLAKKQYFAGDSIGYYQAGNEFLHTENFILIDRHRRIRGVYNGTLPVEIERIKQDIALLKKED